MSDPVRINDLEIIGALTPPTSKAPFNRANLVARARSGTIVHVQTYTSDGMVEGPILNAEDWDGLLASAQAMALPRPVPLTSGAALWIVRPGLPRRERVLHDLRANAVLLHERFPGRDDAWLFLVDESRPAANELRDRWRQEALDAARMLGWSGQWPRAEVEAESAHALSRGLDPEALAFLILAYERCGRDVRAKGILTMARRSRGEDFAQQVGERLALLRREVSDPGATARVTSQTVRRTSAPFAKMKNTAQRGVNNALKLLPSMKTAAA